MSPPKTPWLCFDLSAHAPDLPTRAAVRLHPRRAAVRWDESHLGGPIAWPASEPWPSCEEHGFPLVVVLQLRASDVPELPFPAGKDLFQLLWCPAEHGDVTSYGPRPYARWRRLRDPLAARSSPAVPEAVEGYIPKPCSVSLERVKELPSAFELADERVAELDRLLADRASKDVARLGLITDQFDEDEDRPPPLYQYHFSVAPGTKVGGYADWSQDPNPPTCECGSRMEHLVTIASAEFDGSYQRWMPLADRWVWESEYEVRHAVQSPAGLLIGDMDALRVFVCLRDPEHPVRGVAQ